MIDAKEAAKKATDYFNSLYEDKSFRGLRLEEVEQTEDGLWLVTLRFDSPAVGGLIDREYKLFTIKAESGEVLSMKVRKI